MLLKFYTLDVFTHQKFTGNPLAVVLGADDLSTAQMLQICKEFNLSETTFICKPEDPSNTAKMRIFFPGGEMPFAGHPTIGSALLLAELWGLNEVRFELLAGLTQVQIVQGVATLTAPVIPFHVPLTLPSIAETAACVGLAPDDIGFDDHKVTVIEGGPRFFYVPVNSQKALARSQIMQPHWSNLIARLNADVGHLRAVDGAYLYTRGVNADFCARMYAPTGGIPEDPATGSATAMMAAQLLRAEALVDGARMWSFEQGYEMGRPSNLTMYTHVSSGTLRKVYLSGQAVRVMQGEINFAM